MSESKTPFELRLEMLQMARQILERNWEMQRDIAFRTWDGMIEAAHKANEAMPKMPDSMIPKFPTLDEIMAQAEKMNSFVSGLSKPASKK